MNVLKRMRRVYQNAVQIPFDDKSRLIIMSDCHRGDDGWADSFSRNQNLCFAALTHYDQEKFTYIEAGDGDELWENRKFSRIVKAHGDIFWLINKFYETGRFHSLYGNHDMDKKYAGFYHKQLTGCGGRNWQDQTKMYENILFHEALVLSDQASGNQILVTHGHQVDRLNMELWRLARFLVRHLWLPLETLGVNDPTSTPESYRKKETVENRLKEWASAEKTMIIAGHNHQAAFSYPGDVPYFNAGSCVHPRCITAIEIDHGNIMLVKWSVQSRHDGTLFIGRDVLQGPELISNYFTVR